MNVDSGQTMIASRHVFSGTSLVAILAALVLATGCSRKEGQPYLVTGTISFAEAFRLVPEEIESQGGRVDLLMTVRSSPNIGDIVAQRRWRGIKSRHQFGLGKGEDRVKRVSARHDRIFVTAMVDVYGRNGRIERSYTGWTEKSVAVGSSFLEMKVDREAFSTDPREVENFPIGGWYSPSFPEEAPPPGQRAIVPGARLFSGTADVPLDLRYVFRQFTFWAGAVEDPENPSSEFRRLTAYQTPSFPLKFSIHAEHKPRKTSPPVDRPMHIAVMLDVDGDPMTTGDQSRVVTDKPIDIGASDLQLLIDPRRMLEALMKSQGKTKPGAKKKEDGLGPARAVASGQVVLPPEFTNKIAADAKLWLTVRDAAKNTLLLVKQLDSKFPAEFSLSESDSMGGGTVRVNGPFVVRAIATAGDPSGSDDDTLIVTSKPIPALGAKNIILTLRKR